MSGESVAISVADAEALATQAFAAQGVRADIAQIVSQALIAAEIDGQKGHGLSRVAAYAAQARSGKVDGAAEVEVARVKPGLFVADARFGFAYPALAQARAALISTAPEQGIACAAVKNSHHCGVLGHQVEALAEAGLVALMVANAPKALPPAGGVAPLFGTNPIAFAAPRESGPPLVIDLSLSVAARGKVMAAAKLGAPIPEGWAIGPDGAPTTDAETALKGAMTPAGGPKGAALALMVEVLAGALAGPHFSFEATDFFAAQGAPPALGQFLIAIEPGAAAAGAPARIEALLAEIAAQPGARIPGERRLAARAAAARDGLMAPAKILDEIKKLAG